MKQVSHVVNRKIIEIARPLVTISDFRQGFTIMKTFKNARLSAPHDNYSLNDSNIGLLSKIINLRIGVGFKSRPKITDAGLSKLVDLVKLNISQNEIITGEAFKFLSKLKTLQMERCKNITSEQINLYLTNLTNLDISNNNKITDLALKNLSKLCCLKLSGNCQITDAGIENLTIS